MYFKSREILKKEKEALMQVYSLSNADRIIIVYASNMEEAYTLLSDQIGGNKTDWQLYSLRETRIEKGIVADIKIATSLKLE